MESWTIIGLIAGLITTAGFLPQLIKGLRTRRMDDVSLLMPMILLAGMSLWLIYGVMIDELPVILWNGIAIALNAGILLLKLLFSNHHDPHEIESNAP